MCISGRQLTPQGRYESYGEYGERRGARFRAGLVQLDEVGVVHVPQRPGVGDQEPVLAAVGELQFEVARFRHEHEFGCPVSKTPAPWVAARRVTGAPGSVGGYGVSLVENSRGRNIALFSSPVVLARLLEEGGGERLAPVGIDARDPVAGLAY